jgi:8-oxo-dGTP diphosphatase
MNKNDMRNAIRSEIVQIIPLDALEEATITQVLTWIDSGVDLCRIEKPATPPQHLVSYFILVDGDHLLLVDHINAQLWLPTGGHVEPGEHPRTTVLREVEEELSIKGEFLKDAPFFLTSTETVGKTSGHRDVSLWYLLKGNKDCTFDFDATEFNEVKWFHKNDIPLDQTDPHMERFLRKLYP